MSRHQYPPKTDEKEFESLVKELCKKAYGIEFQLYGRNGQAQKGGSIAN